MQPNPSAQSDKKRFITDAIARRVVTVFGLMVLVMFLLLIMHILSNAYPLLNKPTISFDQTLAMESTDNLLSIQELGDQTTLLSKGQCEVVVHNIGEAALEPLATFAHPCSSVIVEMPNNGSHDSHYGLIRSDGLVELFGLFQTGSDIKRRLVSSFVIPNYKDLLETHGRENLHWKLDKYRNKVVLYSVIDNAHYLSIWTQLNTLSNVQTLRVEQTSMFVPVVRFDRVIIERDGQAQLINQQGSVVQIFTSEETNVEQVLLSPNQRTVYVSTNKGQTLVWRNANIDGKFAYVNAGLLVGLKEDPLISVQFDRQTLIGIAADAGDRLYIFNSATNEVVTTRNIGISSQALHWYNNTLYLVSKDKLHVYNVANTVGVTTWSSLFSPVQYTGYTQAEYIWQTSQSAVFAEPKFSLVPLIIGSLKASILALFVAIPLALGAAIYTAYFASSKVRNWVKPSIEMVEAIPSVIIGFVAAVWLAPFAERSLLALLILLVCTPLIVITLAVVHGVFTQTAIYHTVRRYYLFIVSVTVLLLVVGIFQGSMLLQTFAMQSADSWLGNWLAQITITKTTIVVALALGIAVAPTIYSLVDDALFEVPEGVKQASFALGATELQTLTRVVLVVALPSIISAIMLGLGRAFGETMIVLMVTGNTPIADWDLLSGLRALTSNLAIELQESSIGTAHYHILFLTAAILFAFTFVINTIAAVLKRRLQAGDQHA
jgi:phosphate transport system permease protein